MTTKHAAEYMLYVLVVVLCLVVLALVLVSPGEFLTSKVVYQGF